MLLNFDILFSSLAIAAIVTTITKGSIFKPLRESIKIDFLSRLLHCPYCLSHWVSALAAGTMTQDARGFITYTFALVTVSSLFTFPLILYIRWLDNV